MENAPTDPVVLTQRLEPLGPACALVLTDDEVRRVGGGKRAAVRVRIGHRETPLRLAVMGGKNLIGLSKAARAALDVEIGDEVTATVWRDDEPRVVEVPDELRAALDADAQASSSYDALSFTHRKEYATWVGSAVRADTRRRRALRAVQMLRDGLTR